MLLRVRDVLLKVSRAETAWPHPFEHAPHYTQRAFTAAELAEVTVREVGPEHL